MPLGQGVASSVEWSTLSLSTIVGLLHTGGQLRVHYVAYFSHPVTQPMSEVLSAQLLELWNLCGAGD